MSVIGSCFGSQGCRRCRLQGWCRRRDSNPRPQHYECRALPAELLRPTRTMYSLRPCHATSSASVATLLQSESARPGNCLIRGRIAGLGGTFVMVGPGVRVPSSAPKPDPVGEHAPAREGPLAVRPRSRFRCAPHRQDHSLCIKGVLRRDHCSVSRYAGKAVAFAARSIGLIVSARRPGRSAAGSGASAKRHASFRRSAPGPSAGA